MPKIDYRKTSPETAALGYFDTRPQLPYMIPLFAFLIVYLPTTFGKFGGLDWQKFWFDHHPFFYGLKTLLAAVLLWYFWRYFTQIRWTHLGLGVAIGLLGTVQWIGTEYFAQWVGLSKGADYKWVYNPDLMLGQMTWAAWAYLIVRVVGPTLVVPIMEEVFFRDFLQRAFIRGGHFQDVPVGTFTWFSLIGVAAVFGINHGHMWLAGFGYGLLMGLLVIRTKSIGACIVAHAVTNLTLYLYVIYTGDWQFM